MKLKFKYRFQLVKFLLIFAVFFAASLLIWRHFQTSVSAAWFDDSFIYRNAVPITTHNAAENNVYQAVTIDTSGAGQFQADCGDLRWTDQGGNLLPYYISSGCGTASTVVHVFFDVYPAGAQTLYYYYGNPNATNGFSTTAFPTACAQSCTVGTIASQEKTTGPVAYFKFDEGSGTTINNSVSAANSGVLTAGSGTWLSDDNCISGKCYRLNSSSVSIPDSGNLDVTTGVSIEGWIKPRAMSAVEVIANTAAQTASTTAAGSGLTLSNFVVSNVANRILVVGTTGENATACDVSGVTFGGVALTKANSVAQTDTYSMCVSLWYLINPTVSTADIVATWTGSIENKSIGAMVIYNVAQEAPEVTATNTCTSSCSTINTNIVTSTNNAWVVDAVGSGVSGNYSTTQGGQSEDYDISMAVNNSEGAGSHKLVSAAGSTTLGWSIAGGNRMAHVLAAFKPISIVNFVLLGKGRDAYQLEVDLSNNVTGYINTSNSVGTTYSNNTWTHVALTYDVSTIKIYLNGVLKNSTAASGNITTNSTALSVGDSGYLGDLDDFKLYNYARTAAQIKSDFNSKSAATAKGAGTKIGIQTTDALSNGLVGYWKMDEASWNGTSGEIVDYSGRSANGTSVNSANTTTGKFGNAGIFDGVSKYATYTYVTPAVDSFTAATWVYISGDGNSGINGIMNGDKFRFFVNNSGNYLRSQIGNSGTYDHTSTVAVSRNSWHHIALTFDGNSRRYYLDGVLSQTNNTYGSGTGWGTYLGTIQTNAYYLNGSLDEARVYNRALTPAEVQQLYNWAPGPVGYWKFDEGAGNPSDFSTNGNNGTATAGSGGFVNGKFGKGYNFDGSATTISAGSNTVIDNMNAFTIGAWVYPRSDGEIGEGVLISKESGGDSGGWLLRADSSALDRWALNINRGTQDLISVSASNSRVDNTWQYLSVSYDGSLISSNVKFYVNGVLTTHVTDQNGSGTREDDANQTLIIGNVPGAAQTFDGNIDELKIYNYVRTPKQIIEDMNAGHPAGGSPVSSMQDYWKLDEGQGYYATSSGISATTGSISPSISIPPSVGLSGWQQAGKFGKALAFNGTNNYINFGDLAYAKNVGTMSASFWIRPNALATTTCLLCKWNNTAGAASRGWGIETDDSDSTKIKLEFSTDGNTGIASALTATATLTNNSWAHVAMVYDSSGVTNADILKLYVNGRQKTLTFTGTIPNLIQDNSISTRAGASSDGARFFSGMIDEIKFYSGALSAAEILVDYNRGSSIQFGSLGTASQSASMQYCVPGDSSSCTPPVAEWLFDERTGQAKDSSGNGNNGELTGGAFWTTGKNGSAVNLSGVSQYIAIADPGTGSILDFSNTSNITLEAWIYPTSFTAPSTGDCMNYISKGPIGASTTANYGLQICNDTPKLVFYYSYSSGTYDLYTSTNQNLTLNTWNHIAATYTFGTGSSMKLYVNGNLQPGSWGTSGNNAPDNNNIPLWLGADDYGGGQSVDEEMIGKIDEVKIFNYIRTPAQIAWDYNRGKPVAHWKFDECQGTTLNDSSGNGNVGTWSGSGGGHTSVGTCVTSASTAWYNGRTGKYNGSLDFDGGDDVVNAGSNAILDDLGPYSLSFWMKPDTNASGYIISKRDSCTGPWRLDATSGALTWFKTGTGTDVDLTANNAYSDGVWSHVVLTWDGTINYSGAKFYVNGKQVSATGNNAGSPLLTDATCSVRIGDRSNNSAPFEGQIDDVKIFNHALTPTQVGLEYNQSSAVRFGPATGSP